MASFIQPVPHSLNKRETLRFLEELRLKLNGLLGAPGAPATSIDHTGLSSIGTNTHDQIDTHISSSDVHFERELDVFTLSAAQITSKAVNLANTPVDNDAVVVSVSNSGTSLKDIDYSISGSSIVWSGLGFDGIVEEGDVMEVHYTI